MVYRFGDFELDTRSRQLRRKGRTVHVQPRVFEVLCYLVANPGRAISREELLERIWSGVSVEGGSLTRAMRGVRVALRSDRGLRAAIQTVRGFGYRLAACVESAPDAAMGAAWKEPARPFVGREAALERLAAAAEAVQRGERRVVSIFGEPGSGKSALARRGLALTGPHFRIGEGQCLQGFGARTPYLPILEALVNLGRAEERRRDGVRDAIRRAAPSWRCHLPALFDSAQAEPLRVGLQQDQMLREIIDAIELMARDAPVALLLEDLHWADQATLALVGALARRSIPARLLIVSTARSTELAAVDALRALRSDLLASERSLELETGALSRDAVGGYAAAVLGDAGATPGRLSEPLVDWLWERSDGHPLFLVQLVEHLAGLGLPAAASGAPLSRERLDAVGIPATLGQLIGQWVGRLEEADRRLLRAASVAGLEFDLRAVQFALGIDAAEAEARCDRLCARGWLQFRDFESWADGSVGARLRFAHAMYAEALYAEIPPAERGRLHRAIAERLERGHSSASAPSSEIASHYERAGAREQAARHRVAAAVSAASRQAVDEAIHHAERGLDELRYLGAGDRDAAESDLRMSIALALAARHGFANERVEEGFARACELAQKLEDRSREVAATWGISACRQMRGEIEAARGVAERLHRLAESAGEPRYLEYALGLQAIIAYFQGRFADCVAHAEAALEVLRRSPVEAMPAHAIQDTEVTVGIYSALSHWHLGEPAVGREVVESALRRARSLGHPFTEALAEAFTAIFFHRVGDTARQREHAARGRSVSEAAGIPLWRNVARFMEICAEPVSEAQLVQLRATLQEMARSGGLGGTFFIGLLAELELDAGSVENARTLCAIGFSMAERTTEHNNLPALHLAAARAAADAGARERHFEQAADWAQRLGSVALAARIEAFRAA